MILKSQVKITKSWLQTKSVCNEGIEWAMKNAKDEEGVEVVKKLIADKKLNWANWLIVRIMSRPQCLAYAIFAAEQVIDIYEKKNIRRIVDPEKQLKQRRKCLKTIRKKIEGSPPPPPPPPPPTPPPPPPTPPPPPPPPPPPSPPPPTPTPPTPY